MCLTAPQRGPLPKLLWADLLILILCDVRYEDNPEKVAEKVATACTEEPKVEDNRKVK